MLFLFLPPGYGHSYNSERSSIVQMIIFLILAGDKTEWTGQLLADVAVLLTTDAQGEKQAFDNCQIMNSNKPNVVT